MKVFIYLILLASFLSSGAQSTKEAPANYYDDTEGLTGDDLKLKLHQIIRNHKVRNYGEFRDTILPDLDEDPSNPDNIILFYKNNSIPKADFANGDDAWNREHTWPSSHGFPETSDTTYTDAHNLRPSDATVNESKSNKDFDDLENTAENVQGEAPDTYTNDDFWEPRDEIKGDVARILFYMDVRYECERLNLKLVERESFSGDPELGVLYTLIQWHELDPVDDAERERHEGVFGYQENRNPFIDHPEWVAEVFGSTTDPLLIVQENNFSTDFGTVEVGSSLVQGYEMKAFNLRDDVSVKVEVPFSLSIDQTNWSDSIGFVNDVSGEQVLDVFIRYTPSEENEVAEATVLHFTDGDTVRLEVFGEEGGVDLITIEEARQKSLGESVFITGVVLDNGNNSSNNRIIYDGSAGIVVRSFDTGSESANLLIGDSITVSGSLGDFNNLLQISESPIVIEVKKQNASLPTPQVLTLDQIGEEHESELVTVENVFFTSTGQFQGGGSAGNFDISDGTNSFIFRIGSSNHPLVETDVPSDNFNLTGFIGQFRSDYQISPRTLDDLEILESTLGVNRAEQVNGLIYPNPVRHSFSISNELLGGSASQLKTEIIDLKGRRLVSTTNSSGIVNVSDLRKGLYLVVVTKGDQRFYTRMLKD